MNGSQNHSLRSLPPQKRRSLLRYPSSAVPMVPSPSWLTGKPSRTSLASIGLVLLGTSTSSSVPLTRSGNTVAAAVGLQVSMVLSVCVYVEFLSHPLFMLHVDVHQELEVEIADFLGTEASILYSQGFSTISSVIPAFSKRGDIIVADRGVTFAIQKGLQISRSTIKWFDHNDLKSLEDVLISIEKETKRRRAPLTRRFIVTEGIFERDGAMVDLPKLVCALCHQV